MKPKTAAELAEMPCSEMLRYLSTHLERDLSMSEDLQLAMLSGAYKTGGGIVCYDLERPPRNVMFPHYLRAIGCRG